MNDISFMESPAFFWMESAMDIVLWWLFCFFFLIILKIFLLKRKRVRKSQDSMLFTEGIGLPLTLLQPVVFIKALSMQDWLGALLTLWWGPGFVAIGVLVLLRKKLRFEINWAPYSRAISWLCKGYYLVYIGLAWTWNMPKLMFALSAWIASDQIEKTFASLDADRTRRTFHDFWLIRILYPTLLWTPFFYNLDWHWKAYGALLFFTWAAGLFHVYRQNEFMNLPDDPTLLRNMSYFKKGSKR